MLESREVPAVWDPLNGSLDSTVAQNWLANTNTSTRFAQGVYAIPQGEDLIFGETVTTTSPNPLYGQPGQQPTITTSRTVTADCDLKQLASGSPYGPPPPPASPPAVADYYGVRLLEPYTGTVKLLQSANIMQLDIANGKLNQADPLTMNVPVPLQPSAGKITVTQRMGWTGGSINVGGPMAGLLDIGKAATATIAPKNNGTVTTNDTITLLGNDVSQTGSTTTQQGGELVFGAGRQLIVNAFAKFIMTGLVPASPPPGTPAVPPTSPPAAKVTYVSVTHDQPDLVINKDASMTVENTDTTTGLNAEHKVKGTIKNIGGLLELKKMVTLEMNGKYLIPAGSGSLTYAQEGTTSILRINS